jgi:HK97 family phage portal protein
MGMLRRLIDRLDPPRETRAADPSWAALAGQSGDWPAALIRGGDISGWGDRRPVVTPSIAENLSIIATCVSAIATALASLPAYVYQEGADGREIDETHPLAALIRNGPNARQSWPDFIEWFAAQAALHGNGLAEIIADRRTGQVMALEPIPWGNVTPLILPSGRLAFDIAPLTSLNGGTGQTRRLLDTEVIHLKDRSDDGLIGRSRLARCASPARTALNQEAFGEFLYANRATPSAAVTFKAALSPENRRIVRTALDENWAGVRNAGKVLVLDNDASVETLSITPENLEMLAARRFSTEELCRLYQVPPPIAGIWDHSTFTNSETAGRWFAQFTLAPWIRKIEEAFRRSVFSTEERATHALEIDLSGFLRGDAEARWRAHEIAVKNGILTANEVREVEGWNPRPELDGPPPADPAGAIL